MQKEIASLIESMTKKRDELNAAIGALSRVRITEVPRRIAPIEHDEIARLHREIRKLESAALPAAEEGEP